MIEILSCPFCGGEAKIYHQEKYSSRPKRYCVHCANAVECAVVPQTKWCDTIEEAVAIWNTQTPLAEPEPLTSEQLKQMGGEPVYAILRAKDEYGMPTCFKDGWYLAIVTPGSIFIKSNDATILVNGDYGVDIKLYAHKPKTQPAPKKGGR